jgi:protein-tyrosine-phosphatase
MLGYTPSGQWLRLVQQSVGLDMREHQPRAVDSDDISRAELILMMDVESWHALATIHPDAMHKSVLLGIAGMQRRSAPIEIPDPRDSDQTVFRAIISQLQACTESLVRQRNAQGPAVGHLDQASATRQ